MIEGAKNNTETMVTMWKYKVKNNLDNRKSTNARKGLILNLYKPMYLVCLKIVIKSWILES